jgi:hypothetical protein
VKKLDGRYNPFPADYILHTHFNGSTFFSQNTPRKTMLYSSKFIKNHTSAGTLCFNHDNKYQQMLTVKKRVG